MRKSIKAAILATFILGGLAAAPAAARERYDRGGYDNSYREQSRWDRDRGDRHDRGRSWRRDRDDDRRGYRRDRDDSGRHHQWRGRDRYDR
jgi:hypothetical protein